MSRLKLFTTYIYSIRNTSTQRVYRSSRNPQFLIKVRTLSEMTFSKVGR